MDLNTKTFKKCLIIASSNLIDIWRLDDNRRQVSPVCGYAIKLMEQAWDSDSPKMAQKAVDMLNNIGTIKPDGYGYGFRHMRKEEVLKETRFIASCLSDLMQLLKNEPHGSYRINIHRALERMRKAAKIGRGDVLAQSTIHQRRYKYKRD